MPRPAGTQAATPKHWDRSLPTPRPGPIPLTGGGAVGAAMGDMAVLSLFFLLFFSPSPCYVSLCSSRAEVKEGEK